MNGESLFPKPGRPAGWRVLARRWPLWAVAAAAAGLLLFLWRPHPEGPTEREPEFPPPPVSASPFLNTKAGAEYVGSEACRRCHEGRHASFRSTGMGRSMAVVDPAREPADAAFDHPESGRRYEVFRKDGRLYHRELQAGGAEPLVLCEYPLEYVVGSGRHSRTYLCEAEGFLVESPLTWYDSRGRWGMSPGYDSPAQGGFQRAVDEGCLFCHAGRAEAVGASLHRMKVIEPAIGCERCHGPGSLHVGRHAAGAAPDGRVDYTIVNPKHLSRELSEAVCQQCHLRSDAVVPNRGRSLADFRPGLPLEDFRQDYRFAAPGHPPMTVVGHVEQLHLSRCYQRSDSLTCLTCHTPHAIPRGEERAGHYRAVCLQCHAAGACQVDPGELQAKGPGNDCVRCHMPHSATEIPHLAFTHHRIGVHAAPEARDRPPPEDAVLEVFLGPGRLGDLDRDRSLGLGYLEAANRASDPRHAEGYRGKALGLLSAVYRQGLRDPVLEADLARLRFQTGEDAFPLAERALDRAGLTGNARCEALFLAADGYLARGEHGRAAAALRELTGLRRHHIDWLMLADCERALGNEQAHVQALEAAVRINNRLGRVHSYLAGVYAARGDAARAAWHRRAAAE